MSTASKQQGRDGQKQDRKIIPPTLPCATLTAVCGGGWLGDNLYPHLAWWRGVAAVTEPAEDDGSVSVDAATQARPYDLSSRLASSFSHVHVAPPSLPSL